MAKSLPLELVLKQNEVSFSKKERIIADYLSNNIDNIEIIKIETIAKNCNVNYSSIYSFFKKIHINSIKELITMITEEKILQITNDNKTYHSLMQEIYWNIIEKNSQVLNDDNLQKFINYLLTSNLIYIIGLGESNLAATELSRRLCRFGFQAFALEPEKGEMALKVAAMKKNDLLISISNSGNSTSIIEATKIAKKNGRKIISISGNNHTNLSKLSELNINLYPAPFGNNDSTLISPLLAYVFFIDSVISKMLDTNFQKHMSKRKDILNNILNLTNK